jgi:hypothetical protein
LKTGLYFRSMSRANTPGAILLRRRYSPFQRWDIPEPPPPASPIPASAPVSSGSPLSEGNEVPSPPMLHREPIEGHLHVPIPRPEPPVVIPDLQSAVSVRSSHPEPELSRPSLKPVFPLNETANPAQAAPRIPVPRRVVTHTKVADSAWGRNTEEVAANPAQVAALEVRTPCLPETETALDPSTRIRTRTEPSIPAPGPRRPSEGEREQPAAKAVPIVRHTERSVDPSTVHIGAIEVHVVPPPAPTTPQPAVATVAAPRSRQTPQGPLARDYVHSFGLRQS